MTLFLNKKIKVYIVEGKQKGETEQTLPILYFFF